jgi:membrane-associated phospholipid phosphatase
VGQTLPATLRSTINTKSLLTAGSLSAGYLLLAYLLIGFKTDQLFLVGLFNAFYFATPGTRKFIVGFSVFIVFWILFDFMKAFPNYTFNSVHIESLYNAEKTLFGIDSNGVLVTPNEFFKEHSHTFLDVMSGLFYLCWMPVPMGFAAYLFFKYRKVFLRFSLTFLLVNLLGFVIYYLYPAAPPWYVEYYGFDFIANTNGNTAGLIGFDYFFGINIFASLYSKSSNVFAAMPSLHSAYPLIVIFYGLKYKLGRMNIVFGIVTLGIWFAAVYSSHHYVLDVLAGIICALVGIYFFNILAERSTPFKKWLTQYELLIS